jgi:hypothetical protein
VLEDIDAADKIGRARRAIFWKCRVVWVVGLRGSLILN